MRVLALADGSVRSREVLRPPNSRDALRVVPGPTGILVFRPLSEGPSQVDLVEPSGAVTRLGKPGSTSSCPTAWGLLSLDEEGWVYTRDWSAAEWARRVQVGPGVLQGCAADGDGVVLLWEAAGMKKGAASPEPIDADDLPLDAGCAIVALMDGQQPRGVELPRGRIGLPGADAALAAGSALPTLPAQLVVRWTGASPGEHVEPETVSYSYDVAANRVSAF